MMGSRSASNQVGALLTALGDPKRMQGQLAELEAARGRHEKAKADAGVALRALDDRKVALDRRALELAALEQKLAEQRRIQEAKAGDLASREVRLAEARAKLETDTSEARLRLAAEARAGADELAKREAALKAAIESNDLREENFGRRIIAHNDAERALALRKSELDQQATALVTRTRTHQAAAAALAVREEKLRKLLAD